MKTTKNRLIVSFLRMAGVLGALIICAAIFRIPANALEPPAPEESKLLKGTQELTRRLESAREIGNHRIDTYLLLRAINKAKRAQLQMQGKSGAEIGLLAPEPTPPPGRRGMPTTGNVRILTLLIDFNDHMHTNAQNIIHSNLFGAGDPARAPYESLAVYYDRSSYQQLNLSGGNTLGWYRTAYSRPADPGGSWSDRQKVAENLIKEALNHYNAQGHDFTQYDNDGDGTIDYVVVIWAGPNGGWATLWWGWQSSFQDAAFTIDGKRLGKFSWQWEARPVGTAFTPVVVIHETGHALGLPDYYDYDSSVGPDGGVGGLDMMDANRGDHNGFSKWVLDWITPTFAGSGSQMLTLQPSGISRDAVAIWPGIAPTDLFTEFLIAQNRHRVGNDSAPGMPGDGMLIWHVDAHLNASGTNFLYDNSWTSHKLLRLMEADGLEEIETGDGAADAGDYYVQGKALGRCTAPSSKNYAGGDTGIEIYAVSTPGIPMSATFKIGAQALADYTVSDISVNPASIYPGDAVQVTYTARNQGGNPTVCVNMGIYLSQDATISSSDTLLKSWGLPNCNIAACNSTTQTWTVNIPSGTNPGSYHIGVLADITNYQAEMDEANNAASKPVTIRSGNGDGWASMYSALGLKSEAVAQLRKLRDDLITKTDRGRLYLKVLYEGSEQALALLETRPELLQTAGYILQANIGQVDSALDGKKPFLKESAAVLAFLDRFSETAPSPLKILSQAVKAELLKAGKSGETFFGFRMPMHLSAMGK